MIAIAVIPARLGSTRLPRKILADLNGHPLLWHVWNRVRQSQVIAAVYVATDSNEVRATVESWGGQVFMTNPNCRSGTERVAECLGHLNGDLIVNVQGDEPLIDPSLLDALVDSWRLNPTDVVTPIYPIRSLEELCDPNAVKVARSTNGYAIYFSRSAIPFLRDVPLDRWLDTQTFWGHTGVYGYSPDALAAYRGLPVGTLELSEKLEQLRFLEAGYRILTIETEYRSVSVDIHADLEKVRIILSEQMKSGHTL
jgi:3-deoxy-manno-octulosonate cytidylyltransferase (CMP-KDO synthetase)